MDTILINPEQCATTEMKFILSNLFRSQTSRTLSWKEIPKMDEIVTIIHPITGQIVEIDPSQEWFWTKEWQLSEQKVNEELSAGQFEDFDNIDDFFAEI